MAFSSKARTAQAKRNKVNREGSKAVDPFYQGDDAFHAGIARDACPYTTWLDEEKRSDWLAGWDQAMRGMI